MTETRFRVVFRGELAEGWDPGKVKQQLVDSLRMTPASAERFLAVPRAIISEQADHRSAARFVSIFASVGVICQLEPICPADLSGGNIGATCPETKQNTDAAAVPPGTLVCPKCGHSQPEAAECSRCGIIFSKYHHDSGTQLGSSIKNPSVRFYDIARERSQWILLVVLLIILAGLLHHLITTRDITHPPGVLVASEPHQTIIRNPKAWQKGQRLIVPMAHFHLHARVLSTERYHFDHVADLSPIDLALGWGPMSDQQVLDQLEIGQGSRRFVVLPASKGPPLPLPVLMTSAANMHMLAANDEIKRKLFDLRRGNLIELDGYLVGVQENGQWTWVSSLSRTDTGDGSCEIVWVERLDVR
jgi:hypothetical protein